MRTQKLDKQEEVEYLKKFTLAFDEKFKCKSKTVYVPEVGVYITCVLEGNKYRVATDFEQAWISGYSFGYGDWIDA